tara:strand:+ start:1014 stop:1712 length:699 start_codon:yes stop_codon:yes gene_type:complete
MTKKLELPDVTLLAATSVEIDQTQLALKISSQNIKFGKIKFLSSSEPSKKYSDIEYISIPSMKISDYSRLIIKDLYKYFETSHCLIVQSDSFVVNSKLWIKNFLKYDYIGAPWPNEVKINSNLILNMKKNPVGNGGFSLRSRKLAKATAKINFDSLKLPIKSEDLVICHYLYEEMIDKGIIFAPPEIAAQFSMENIHHLYGQDVNSVFGFHGKHLKEFFLKKYVLRSSIGEW